MKVARYIGDLLFQYECIVIPGFGGFITKEIPAKIHPVQNHFVPPSKDIVFNVHLKANDGLLINHIVRAEKITYSDAKKKLESFVIQCEAALKNGKRIHFRKVGTLFINEAGFKQFEPDSTQNYLADSFGLKSFISPAIKRTPGGRPISNKPPQDRKAAEVHHRTKVKKEAAKPKVKGPKYIRLNISAILILVLISAYVIFNFTEVKKYYNNHSSLIPFFYPNANEYLVANYVELGVDKLFNIGDELKNVGDKLKINTSLPSDEVKKPELKVEEETESIEDTYKKLLKELERETKGWVDSISSDADIPLSNIEKNTPSITAPIVKEEIIPKSASTARYHIIAGSFQNIANANKFVLELKQKGYHASIAGTNKYEHYRVSYDNFNDLSLANQQLAIIRKEENSAAWILSL